MSRKVCFQLDNTWRQCGRNEIVMKRCVLMCVAESVLSARQHLAAVWPQRNCHEMMCLFMCVAKSVLSARQHLAALWPQRNCHEMMCFCVCVSRKLCFQLDNTWRQCGRNEIVMKRCVLMCVAESVLSARQHLAAVWPLRAKAVRI